MLLARAEFDCSVSYLKCSAFILIFQSQAFNMMFVFQAEGVVVGAFVMPHVIYIFISSSRLCVCGNYVVQKSLTAFVSNNYASLDQGRTVEK